MIIERINKSSLESYRLPAYTGCESNNGQDSYSFFYQAAATISHVIVRMLPNGTDKF